MGGICFKITQYPSPPPLYQQFCFLPCFRYLWSTLVQKYEMEKFRNKQFINFKLHTILLEELFNYSLIIFGCAGSLFL